MNNPTPKPPKRRMHVHRIVFTANDDVECVVRALLGQSNRAINGATKLSNGQIYYRLKKAGIDRWAYRNGLTPLAGRMLDMGRRFAQSQVERDIQPKFSRFAR